MISAFVNLNKPAGMTSASAVARVKHILREKGVEISKIGHFGTLDPDAEGILPIALNRATRLFDHLGLKTKIYYAEFVFGAETDTLDSSGKIVAESGKIPSSEEIKRAAASLIGVTEQLPPKFSAKSVNGRRAYELARAGEEFDLKPKLVKIDDISFLGEKERGVYSFRITCGGGTYIRSVARDIAYKCGTFAYMRRLSREKSGYFDINDAVTISDLADAEDITTLIVPMEKALENFPRYDMAGDGETERLILNGVNLRLKNMPDGIFRFYISGKLCGLGEKDEDMRFTWRVRLI